jgi:hypothetical protein
LPFFLVENPRPRVSSQSQKGQKFNHLWAVPEKRMQILAQRPRPRKPDFLIEG